MKLLEMFKNKDKNLSPDRLMTLEEYARHRGWHKKKVYRLRDSGIIKCTKIGPRSYVNQIDADARIDANRAGTAHFKSLQLKLLHCKHWLRKYRYGALVTSLLLAAISIILWQIPRIARLEMVVEHQAQVIAAKTAEAEQHRETITGLVASQKETEALVELAQVLGIDIAAAMDELREKNPGAPLPELAVSYGLNQAELFSEWYAEKVREEQERWAQYLEHKEAVPSIWPVGSPENPAGYISSPYGPRYAAWGSALARATGQVGWHWHNGIDIAASKGTPIIAAAPGEIVLVEWLGGYGNLVIIDHGYGYSTYYAHLSGFAVEEGEMVERGQVIGYMGSTGQTTGVHLHWEVRIGDVPVDPVKYLGNDS